MSRSLLAITLLASALTGCAAPPDTLDLSLRHASAQGRYIVQLDPPVSSPAINQMHSWQVSVRAADGVPVRNARIAVGGGMPQHGHGLPTRPRITREISDGTYLIEGMKFSMTGWWEIKLAIDAAAGADTVVFNTVVETAGLRR